MPTPEEIAKIEADPEYQKEYSKHFDEPMRHNNDHQRWAVIFTDKDTEMSKIYSLHSTYEEAKETAKYMSSNKSVTSRYYIRVIIKRG